MFFKQDDVIGRRFRVLDTLGQGGVGIVYRVYDLKRNSEVALKVLRPEVAKNRLALERFMREVKAVREINHPGVVPVYDTGRIGEMLFYTMECVNGKSIRSLVKKEKQLDSARTISLMADICEIMEVIHKVVVHRDLSSDNIMIERDGTIRILDFGTARITAQNSSLTASGLHLGKICYSPPEQRASSRKVDHRADLYSLAILFYEMLTGELILLYEPVTAHRPDLAPKFDTFFNKALAEQPEDRFQSAAELREAVRELASAEAG